MKITSRSILSLILVLLLLPTYSTGVFAANTEAAQDSGTDRIFYQEKYINPLYADVVTEDDLLSAEEAARLMQADASAEASSEGRIQSTGEAKSDYFFTTEDAAGAMREGMKNRELTITIPFATDNSDFQTLMDEIADKALEHTGDPREGDYLKWQYAGWAANAEGSVDDSMYYLTLTYTVTYYTNAAQEAVVDQKVAEFLKEAPVSSSNEYKTIKTIYDFVTQNVSYDYDNLSDPNYKLKYTAYAALADHKAVCQGYSVLMYRLLLECGIDCRLITGKGTNNAGETEAHGWNIVKIGDHYYNLDATWDSSYYNTFKSYTWFLRSPDSFERHERDKEYDTDAFHAAYPMSAADYSGHSLSRIEAKEPTFDNPGNSVYWICDDCRLLYSDAEGINQTEIEGTTIAPLAKLKSASLRLSGDIGVNFNYAFSDEVANDPSTRVIMKVGNGKEQSFKVSDAVIKTDASSGKPLYTFTSYVAAKQMRDTIQIHAESDTQCGAVKTYSIRQYADNMLGRTGTDGKVKYLIRVMMHYGAAAQAFLDYNTGSLADEGLEMEDVLEVCNGLKVSDLESYKASTTPLPEGIVIHACNLSLNSETVVRFLFKLEEGHEIGEYTFTIDGKKYTPQIYKDYYSIEIDNVLARDIDKMFQVVVEDQHGSSGSVRYGALTYVRNMLNKESTPDTLAALLRSLYAYNRAAEAYLGS